MPRGKKKPSRKLTTRQLIAAVAQVAHITFKAAPLAVIVQLMGAVISAILPIVTTYFAARTTTELAGAYAGIAGSGERAIEYVIVTAILGIVMTAWNSLQSYIEQMMQYRVEAAMSDRLYEHFLRLDFWRYDDKSTADMYDRASQFARFFPYVFQSLAGIVSQFVTMIAGLVALILVSWWLGLIALIAVVPGIVIQFRLSRASARHWSEHVETRRSRNMIEYSLLQPIYIAELRLYGVVRYLLDLRMKLRDEDEKARIEFERGYILKRLGSDALEAGAEVLALVWTTLQIIAHQQPIGQFIYVQQIVSRAFSGASGFVSQFGRIDEDLANLVDYQRFMELPETSDRQQTLQRVPEIIELRHVSFHYPKSEQLVLDNISLSIGRYQHIAIVGENGAGKSTLIKLITGLYAPTDGVVLVDGEDLRQIDIATWHKYMGVLQQQYLAYGFASAKDNIYFGDVSRPFDKDRFAQAIDRAEARDFLEKLPKGIDNYVSTWMEDDEGNNGVDLSGGQWQRLALARDFYRDSEIVILDEPTSAIDALAEARIFKHLFADKKRTIITISHRLTTIRKADIVYMLKDGKLVEQGTTKELIDKKGEFYHMFESQIRD